MDLETEIRELVRERAAVVLDEVMKQALLDGDEDDAVEATRLAFAGLWVEATKDIYAKHGLKLSAETAEDTFRLSTGETTIEEHWQKVLAWLDDPSVDQDEKLRAIAKWEASRAKIKKDMEERGDA